MRSQEEIEEVRKKIYSKDWDEEKKRFYMEAFEGCVPIEFWKIKKNDIKQNVDVFKKFILTYCKKLKTAHQKGYGLCLLGNNGVGKTYFISYILTKAIKKGKTVYYTTMPELDFNIKRGFDDYKLSRYLQMLLTSDFLAIDEVGKEKTKNGKQTFMDSQVERILKKRFDDAMPVLLGTNLSFHNLSKTYGSTVESIIQGKYQIVQMGEGDYRKVLAREMNKDMRY